MNNGDGSIDLSGFVTVDGPSGRVAFDTSAGGGRGGAVSSGGTGGATADFYYVDGSGTSNPYVPMWTTTTDSSSKYEPFTINVTYDNGEIMSVCQFCGEPQVCEITEKKLVKGQWKSRTTYYYKCGTSKTVGNYKVKEPRVLIGKKCVGFAK